MEAHFRFLERIIVRREKNACWESHEKKCVWMRERCLSIEERGRNVSMKIVWRLELHDEISLHQTFIFLLHFFRNVHRGRVEYCARGTRRIELHETRSEEEHIIRPEPERQGLRKRKKKIFISSSSSCRMHIDSMIHSWTHMQDCMNGAV